MSNPKRPLPEHLATQIATTVPGGRPQAQGAQSPQQGGPQGPVDRRTAALPQAPVPLSAPTDRTMTFDPGALQQPARRVPLPTMMSMPQAHLEREPFRLSDGQKRWIGGPLLAIVVCVLTTWLSGLVSPAAAAKNLGRLRLSSDPEGATVLVDGKVQPHPTPTLIEGEIGATLHVGFRLDGYSDKETDVLVSEGERPFRAHLDQRDVAMHEPEPEQDPTPQPTSLEPPHATKDTGHSKKPASHDKEKQYVQAVSPAPTGSGTVSVHIRPWAIVYIDGNKVRQTPLDNYSLSAGLHTVELVNDVLKKREKVTVELRNGGSEEVRRDWGK